MKLCSHVPWRLSRKHHWSSLLQLGSLQTPHNCSHTTTPLIFTLYSFSRFSIIDYSLCLLLTNFLIAAKVEHNSGDSKAINKIFRVHAGKHSLLNSFICLPIHMMMTITCLFTCKWFNKRTWTFKINSMVNHVFVHWNICFWPSFILEDRF
jgi:hypothetical protein